jgi:hypothetical protein
VQKAIFVISTIVAYSSAASLYTAASTCGCIQYTVLSGETCYSIAASYGYDIDTLRSYNPSSLSETSNPDCLITAGEVLCVSIPTNTGSDIQCSMTAISLSSSSPYSTASSTPSPSFIPYSPPPNTTTNATSVTDWDFCYLPSGILEYPQKEDGCPSQSSLLISLLVYNIFSAALNLFLGHDATRNVIGKAMEKIIPAYCCCFSLSGNWKPYAAIFMTALQIVGMLISTAIAVSNGFTASFSALLGLWSLRPRVALLTWLYDSWHRYITKYQPFPFEYTLRDTILSECLLNLFSTYFALKLLQSAGSNAYGCQIESPTPGWLIPIQMALGWKICAGVASLFILAGQFIHFIKNRTGEQMEDNISGSIFFWASLLIASVNFVTSWEIWGGKPIKPISPSLFKMLKANCMSVVFINVSGSTYCPGGVIATGVTWGVVFVTNAMLRPTFGGGVAS